MLLGDPAPTQADLHFRLFGIPVRVSPFFWIATLFLGYGGREADPVGVLLWIVVVFISILVHELGHATLQRYFGGHPRITLYGFGGLAICNDCDPSPRSQILILLAGPFAGFLLAAVAILAMYASGHAVGFAFREQNIDLESLGLDRVLIQPLGVVYTYFEPVESDLMNRVFGMLLRVNILWGLINLLPVYPLDGGQIARELFTLRRPQAGIVLSLQLSIITAGVIAVYALMNNDIYLCLMFGLLGYGNFQTLQRYRGSWQ